MNLRFGSDRGQCIAKGVEVGRLDCGQYCRRGFNYYSVKLQLEKGN